MNRSRRQMLVGLPAVLLAVSAAADQPHMEAALDHLQSALRELKKASSNKGGHRGNAETLVRKAITEVERGIAYDRSH